MFFPYFLFVNLLKVPTNFEISELALLIIVGTGVLDRPKIELLQYGVIADEQIKIMNDFYDYISVEKYVIARCKMKLK